MSERRLGAMRREIDRIDEQLISLLAQRLRLADELAELKLKLGKGVRDKAREQAVIERARKRAKMAKLDPAFAEDAMRLVISRMAGVELERVGGVGMWAQVQEEFEGYPAQLAVARVLFKYGLRVREDGEITCGEIRIPAVQLAREAGSDRRVVDATARRILASEKLRGVFANLEPIAYLKGVAQQLGLGVIEILPKNASKTGIISGVTGVLAKFHISVRQAVADDPYFVSQPKLTIITDKPVKGKVIDALRRLPSVSGVIVY